ncbi:MAG: calcium/sodium antiporter [Clostridia bacterium]|nr:calcium/sodium antiporter [Clostridia bacterium]
MEYVWLIGGFILLIVGADVFVEGSSNIAKLLKIPSIIIGLTVVAFGTSMPEASVSINAAIAGSNSIAVSNVVGSNIFNLLVVLGASALILPVHTNATAVKKEIPYSIILAVVLGILLCFGVSFAEVVLPEISFFEKISGATFTLGRIGGAVLLVLFALYMYWQIGGALKARKSGEIEELPEEKKMAPFMAVELVIVGLVGIIYGGDLVVDNACIIAEKFGMSETFIGLSIVAIGTSLPELVTSMVAARKGESDLALGNVIGSNIFNIVFILGFSAVLAPMTVDILTICDIIVLVAVSIVGWLFAKSKQIVSRLEGGIMLLMYVVYFVYILLR